MWDTIIDNAPVIIFAILSFASVWGIRKLNLKQSVEEAIITFTKRVLDKSKDLITNAMSPDSDGGRKITEDERSVISQTIYDMLLAEVKGPVGRFIAGAAENFIKGKISLAMDRFKVKVVPDAEADLAAAAAAAGA